MLQDEAQQVYTIAAFQGYNQMIDEQLLDAGFTKDAQNFVVEDGRLTVTKGNTKFVPQRVPGGVQTLMIFYKNNLDGTVSSQLLAASPTNLYKYDNGWVSIKSGLSSGFFSFLNYQQGVDDIIIMSNGIDPMLKYNGNTVANLGGTPPRARSISLHYERIWATVDRLHPNRVYYSDDLNPENWQTGLDEGGFIELPTWDGGVCIGLSTIFDDVVIFKTYNIWKINGTYPGEYQKVQVFSSTGAIAERSIANAGTVAFFLAKDGIYIYDGMQTHLISQPIKDIIKNMNKAYADKAVGVFYDNRYILAIPEGDSAENNCIIEYNLDTKQFIIKRGFNVNTFLVYDNKLIFSNNQGYVLEYDKGDTFDGQPIVAYWDTPYTNLGAPNVVKRSTEMYCTLEKLYGTSLKIDGIFDKKSSSVTVDLPNIKTDKRIKLRCKGRHFRLRFSNVDGSRFSLAIPKLFYDADVD